MLFNFPACILLALEDGFCSIYIYSYACHYLERSGIVYFPSYMCQKYPCIVFHFLSTSLCFQKMFVPEHVCETSCNTSKTSCSTSRCTQPMQLNNFSRRHHAVTVLKPLVMATSFNSGTQASKLDARLTKEQPNLINEELDLQDADSEA